MRVFALTQRVVVTAARTATMRGDSIAFAAAVRSKTTVATASAASARMTRMAYADRVHQSAKLAAVAAAAGATATAIGLGMSSACLRREPLAHDDVTNAALDAMYAGLDNGDEIPIGEVRLIDDSGGHEAYGELTLRGVRELRGKLNAGELLATAKQTVSVTTMVFMILVGASMFAMVFNAYGGDGLIQEALQGLPGGPIAALVCVMLLMFLLGFVLDFIEIVFVVVPIVAVPLLMMGLDPIWLGVLMAMNLQTSFLTPPFGFALFYLRGVAPPEVATTDIYRGAVPFIGLQVAVLLLVALVPVLATWLPGRLS